MNRATPHSVEASPPAPVVGCGYLRTLSTIERLAGFDQTAHSYATAASRCRRFGCWAAERGVPCRLPLDAGEDAPLTLDFVRPRTPGACSHAAGATAPIPFIRSAMVDIVADGEGNYVERRSLKLTTLPERGDALGYLYKYWSGLRAETECGFSNIDTVHLMRAGIIGNMHVVDVSSADPLDFRFDLAGYAIPLGQFEKPRALPVSIYADTTMRDYNTVRLTGAPRLQRVRARLGGTAHHYTRLILPFFDTSGSVARLLIAIRQERGNGIEVKASQ